MQVFVASAEVPRSTMVYSQKTQSLEERKKKKQRGGKSFLLALTGFGSISTTPGLQRGTFRKRLKKKSAILYTVTRTP